MQFARFFIITLLSCSANLTLGQEYFSETPLKPTETIYTGNIQRYGLDYELVNYTFVNGDSSVLNTINIERALLLREASVDKVVEDLNSGYSLLLYSVERSRMERGLNPIDESHTKRTGQ